MRNSVLSKSSRDSSIHRLPRARLMEVGISGVGMLQVRKVAGCRAVRHDSDSEMSLKIGYGKAISYSRLPDIPCRITARQSMRREERDGLLCC